jgi:hypothetical protein
MVTFLRWAVLRDHCPIPTFIGRGVGPNAVNLSPDSHVEASWCHLGEKRNRVISHTSGPRLSSGDGVLNEISLKLAALGPTPFLLARASIFIVYTVSEIAE